MNKLRYINVKKPLLPQIQEASDPDSVISNFEKKKKSDTTVKKIDTDYLAGETTLDTMK